MTNYKVLDLEFSSGVDPSNISNVLGVKSSVVAEYYAGNTDSSGNLLDLSGNDYTLTAAGSPTIAATALLDQDRNPLKSVVLNGSSQGFSRNHEAWMNMFSADFTASFLVNSSSASSGVDDIFGHGGGGWQQIATPTSPTAGGRKVCAYDSTRNVIVAFGGQTNVGVRNNETWEYDGTTWTKITTSGTPSARSSGCMVYDASRQRMVMFGGYTGAYSNDTYEYNGATATWSLIAVAGGVKPSARSSHAMAYDPDRQKVVLYGGYNGSVLGETWEYTGSTATWVQKSTTGNPGLLCESSMVYDSVRSKFVVFGGWDGLATNETWEYTANTTTWAQITTSGTPTARSQHALVYDTARSLVVMCGAGSSNTTFYDYDGTTATWTNRTAAYNPSPLLWPILVYDPVRNLIVLSCGNYSGDQNATWEYMALGEGGIRIFQSVSTGYVTAEFHPQSAAVVTGPSTSLRDGYWHHIVLVRSSSTATVYLDGVAGTPVSVTGKGTDVSATLYLGRGVSYLQGSLIYARIQTSVLTSTQISTELAYWKGLVGGKSTKTLQLPTFARTGTSLAERATGPNGIVTADPNWPAKMSEGGLLIQSQTAQVLTYTKDFSNAVWSRVFYPVTLLSNSPSARYYSVAGNPDGRYLVAGVAIGASTLYYYSSDYGVNWTEGIVALSGYPTFASDSTGQYFVGVLASLVGAKVYRSTDYGVTFSALGSSFASTYALSIACSSDGQHIYAPSVGAHIYESSDGGVTWNERSGHDTYHRAACSSDGQYVVVSSNSGIYVSNDYGVTFNLNYNLTSVINVACSSDGSVAYATRGTDGAILRSINYGVTWAYWNAGSTSIGRIACAADGIHFAYTYNINTTVIRATPDGTNWYNATMPYSTEMGAIFMLSDASVFFAAPSSGASTPNRVLKVEIEDFDTTISDASTPLAPDGSVDMDSIIAGSNNVIHGVKQLKTLTAAEYTFEADIEAGNKDWAYLKNRVVSNAYAYFDLVRRKVGTVGAGCRASIKENRNRCAIHFTGTAASHELQISPANADGDLDFAGDGVTPSIKVWEASCHLGGFQVLPVNRVSAAATRNADSLTYPITFIPSYFIGNTYHNKSLTIELRVKCQYTDTNNIGANTARPFLTIGGNTGTASQTRNHISIYGYNQYVYGSFYSDALTGTQHYMSHTVTDANKWHVYRIKLDFTNLFASTFTKDDVAYTGSSGMDVATYDLDVTNCLLRIGQDYAGTIAGHCEIDYVKIWVGN